MSKIFFPNINKIQYEGRDSNNPLAFKYYDENKVIGGKTMKEYFRFAIAYWHTFCGTGNDPFGPGTKVFPWDSAATPVERAKDKMDAAFEFITKIGAPFYCFHDFDLIEEGGSIAESEKRLQTIVDYAQTKQKETGIKLSMGNRQCILQSTLHERRINQSGFQGRCLGRYSGKKCTRRHHCTGR